MSAQTNNHPLRVLVLATSYPLNPGDSASIFLKHLNEHLHKQGAVIHVVAPAADRGGHVDENGIEVHRFRYMFRPWQKLCYGSGILPNLKRQPLLWLVVPFFLCSFLFAALRIALKTRPDVIHCHWVVPTGAVGLLLSWVTRTPFVVTAHGSDAFAVRGGLMTRIKQYLVDKAAGWTANSKATALAIDPGARQGKLSIIPMGVDTNRFRPDPDTKAANGNQRNLLFIGRLIESKGVSILLEAISRLPEATRKTLVVSIIGEGAEKARLQQQSVDLGIDSITRFVGYVENNNLPQYLATTDLLVGPTMIEGQGVVFLEAMACGVPVIASEVGGVGEVIEHGKTGLLVPAGNADELSTAIQELLEDENKRESLAMAAQKTVQEVYGWERIAERFLTFYRQLD